MKEMIREKRWVLRQFRKTVSVGADMTSDGMKQAVSVETFEIVDVLS